jgi:hypothetical protein
MQSVKLDRGFATGSKLAAHAPARTSAKRGLRVSAVADVERVVETQNRPKARRPP